MARFVILRHIDPVPSRGRSPVIALRDEWSILAFVLPLVWLLFHRLWIAALLVLAATIALGLLALEPAYQSLILPANLLMNAFIGLEASGWRIARARGQGYTAVDVIDAGSREEAELRFAEAARNAGAMTAPRSGNDASSTFGADPVPDVLFAAPDGVGR